MKLYASKYGGRYHRDPSCGLVRAPGMPDTWPQVSQRAAAVRGLTPCRTCKPGPLLTVIHGEADECRCGCCIEHRSRKAAGRTGIWCSCPDYEGDERCDCPHCVRYVQEGFDAR